jgi:UDP-N-acetylmuramoylalanine--D-glutamate ligase
MPIPSRMAEVGRQAFAEKTILVSGIAGRSAIRALTGLGSTVVVSSAAEDVELGPNIDFRGELSTLPAGLDAVVTSPGLAPAHPLLVAAVAAGVPVFSELELAWRLRSANPAPWLIVTGTNGKTTTVGMLASIITASGRRCAAVGNNGVSIIDAVMTDDQDVLAVEASSFQLTFTDSVRARAGVLLNLAEDHLDWHPTMEHYAAQKAKVWRSDVAVANADDAYVMGLFEAAGLCNVERGVTFTLGVPGPGQLGMADGMVIDRSIADRDLDGEALIAVSEIRPAGSHNVANALAAIALAHAVGAGADAVRAGLRSYQPEPHRNQHVLRVAGVDYVDDSKATNPHAAAAALAAYQRVVWIAGGQLKGADIEPLVIQFRNSLVGAVTLGVDGPKVRTALARHAPDLPVIGIDSNDDGAMTAVLEAAASLARAGDVVLLAPAAASKDMFTSYGVRGDMFAAAVRAYAQAHPQS